MVIEMNADTLIEPIQFTLGGEVFKVREDIGPELMVEIDAIKMVEEDNKDVFDVLAKRLALYCNVEPEKFSKVDVRKLNAVSAFVQTTVTKQFEYDAGNPTKPEPPKPQK